MLSNQEVNEYIKSLIERLEEASINEDGLKEIEALIDCKIPNEVKLFIEMEPEIASKIDLFCGYELENVETFSQHYLDMKNRKSVSFFAGNFVDDNFEASSDCGLIYYDKNGISEHYKEDDEIRNLKKILPLFHASGAYSIVMNLDGPSPGELLVVAQDYTFSVLAPSLTLHLKNLIEGIEKEVYKLELDDEYKSIQYPMSWGERNLVMSGKYYLDEFDELVEK